jgi:hypothetical protein
VPRVASEPEVEPLDPEVLPVPDDVVLPDVVPVPEVVPVPDEPEVVPADPLPDVPIVLEPAEFPRVLSFAQPAVKTVAAVLAMTNAQILFRNDFMMIEVCPPQSRATWHSTSAA